jgi:chemotaxis family two-component system response regulator Rcp1
MTRPAHDLDLIEILLVEDREADIELTRQGLEEARCANQMHVARDGVEAMAFLRRESPFADAPRPDLILLDLNLPRKDGRELLAEIKGHGDFRLIPVVILTTSEADRDVIEAYNKHANAYMNKPVDFNQFIEVVGGITDYWFALVKLPPKF